ncbi:MAG: ATP synthase F1 subunit epsilon [Kiritimatiellae bacterium]|nr:ATP synthase F1 subunit epsilon [Kiritimatiellia bacterium]MDD5520561.1 ATP synthase F1 subunit epsilon [Kiritimatiellia bacterium]
MSFNLKIMTPQSSVFEGEVESLCTPGTIGYFGVLSDHAPMISAIGTGVLKIDMEGDIQYYVISGGIAEISREGTTVLAEIVKKVAGPDDAEIELEELEFPTIGR